MLDWFIFGEVFYQGDISDKLREMITIVVLTTSQTLDQLGAHVFAALNSGVSPVEVKEAIYQCTPYIGFPKTLNAVKVANSVETIIAVITQCLPYVGFPRTLNALTALSEVLPAKS